MSRLRSGAVILLLAVPFALYAAWQVWAATRAGAAAPPPPAKAAPAEQLAAAKAKAGAAADEARRVGADILQYRRTVAGDAVADKDLTAAATAAAARATALADLGTFLADPADPKYAGGLAPLYRKWGEERRELAAAAGKLDDWLGDGFPAVGGKAEADAALGQFAALLAAYADHASAFKSKRLVAGWRVRVRAKLVSTLAAAAVGPYTRALDAPLPLDPPRLDAVRDPLGQVKAQLAELDRVAAQARADGLTLPDEVEKSRAAAAVAAVESAAREELLSLFAEPDLFTDPDKAAAWFPKVQAQFDRTQADADRALIRRKVREFCAASLPAAAKLDDVVLVEGEPIPRAAVTVEYASKDNPDPKKLSDLPGGLTEFNFAKAFPEFARLRWRGDRPSSSGRAEVLKPTAKSQVAADYTAARATVTAWSPAEVGRLKKACEGDGKPVEQQEQRRKLADELVGVAPAGQTPPARLWTRLSAVAAAAERHPRLFDAR
ncbi:MAG: hypothetical protein C0501_13605 [Isosphaera sp.]|nr:hypothetical protein [Isosphaera sp.]